MELPTELMLDMGVSLARSQGTRNERNALVA